MSMTTLVSAPAKLQARVGDHSFASIVLICCVGLVASFGVMTRGIDLGAGLI